MNLPVRASSLWVCRNSRPSPSRWRWRVRGSLVRDALPPYPLTGAPGGAARVPQSFVAMSSPTALIAWEARHYAVQVFTESLGRPAYQVLAAPGPHSDSN